MFTIAPEKLTSCKPPVIVVSNRLPFVLTRSVTTGKLERKQSAGGLVTAVAPVVIECKGLWVGWPGIYDLKDDEEIPESHPDDKALTAGLLSTQVVSVNMDHDLFNSYYNGCCNGTFWPLFHSMPDRAIFHVSMWKDYETVNEQFAQRTLDALRKVHKQLECSSQDFHIPIIWIHDYHLMLASNTIRQVAEEEDLPCKLGFFLHIPFPSWDLMKLCPWDAEILQGLLGCDLVGFHIEDYCVNFIDCCQRRLGCRVERSRMLVEIGGRTIQVKALPIGIPFDHFVHLAEVAPQVIKDNETERIILGVDRLDYTKGLVNRIKAFERLLEKYPEHIEKVMFMQIAVPSRTDVKEYQALKEEIDQLIGRINGKFTKPNWSPIRYIYGCVSQDQLAAFYRDSAVALVTPLRDGMNLVAKEFVACQIKDPGVLILSPFAGAGGMMHEALLTNPYELEEVADTLHRALIMDLDERVLRMIQLRRRERVNDVDNWLQAFLSAMGALYSEGDGNSLPVRMHPLRVCDFDQFLANYIDPQCKLCLILDYDGTLACFARHPDLAIMPEETRRTLERLSHIPEVTISVVSGRSLDNLQKMVGIDGITYAANHGLEILHPDGSSFIHPVPDEYDQMLISLIKNLQEHVCHDGAWIENKGLLVTFHYHETPLDKRQQIVEKAMKIFHDAGFQPHAAYMAIEAKPPVKWDRGRACIYILRTIYGVDWSERVKVIYAGDDDNDERAMETLQGIACTFRVTSDTNVHTAANFRLTNPDAVLTMLKWVEKEMSRRSPKSPRSVTGSFIESGHSTPPHRGGSLPRPVRKFQCSMSFDDESSGGSGGGSDNESSGNGRRIQNRRRHFSYPKNLKFLLKKALTNEIDDMKTPV